MLIFKKCRDTMGTFSLTKCIEQLLGLLGESHNNYNLSLVSGMTPPRADLYRKKIPDWFVALIIGDAEIV